MILTNSEMSGFNQQTLTIDIPYPEGATPFSLDIGGSLAKLVYISRNSKQNSIDVNLVTFDTDSLDTCLDYINRNVIGYRNSHRLTVKATGVGCTKYREQISSTLDVHLEADHNEMTHAAKGLQFLWPQLPREILLYEQSDIHGLSFKTSLASSGVTPCLLVNLGSALTIEKLDVDGNATGIVGGSSQCGLALMGLGALLTSARSHDEFMDMAERGDRLNVDLRVADTAGEEYNSMPQDGMVSSFGKAAKLLKQKNSVASSFKEEDIASSLLFCVTDQLAQNIYLTAKCEGLSHAVFCGSFLGQNQASIQLIKSKIDTCSKYLSHKLSTVFLRQGSYMGAIGSLTRDLKPQVYHNGH